MARRPPPDDGNANGRHVPDSLNSQGYITFKPARNRQGNKNWRIPELGALALNSGVGFLGGENITSSSPLDSSVDSSDHASTSDTLTSAMKQPAPLPRLVHNQSLLQPNKINAISAKATSGTSQLSERQPTRASDDTDNTSPAGTQSKADPLKQYSRLFGELPDLIHISERTGKFDGEVVFIGHPNRNVSAHQWFAEPFQWVNVGTWSHTHQKIEGSLASDRISSVYSLNSIEQFKHLAQCREKRVIDLNRSRREQQSHATMVTSSTPSSFTENLRTLSTQPTARPSPYHSAFGNIMGQGLEDPFVTPAKPRVAAVPLSFSNRKEPPPGLGSMDFTYEFPIKSTPPTRALFGQHNRIDSQQAPVQGDQNRQHMTCETETEQDLGKSLPEIQFGEEAEGTLSIPMTEMRTRIKNQLTELGNQPRKFNPEQKIAISDMPELNSSLRSLFPPGPTVANPYRGSSTLNAKAAPYVSQNAVAQVSDASETERSASTVIPAPNNLHFSDPDGGRQHIHEIVNGFHKQAPTPQTFRGPFFAESVPTTSDPAASLILPVNHEEKLKNWFRDGQRPLRQTEYADRLVAATVSNDQRHNFGAVGDSKSRYENTPLFLRVYENLLEYTSAGAGFDPFTKAWKPAPQHMCDPTPEGNSSFFEGRLGGSGFSARVGRPTSSKLAVPSQRPSQFPSSRTPAAAPGSVPGPPRWNASSAHPW